MREQAARHMFTTEEFHLMGEAGIFSEDDRVELLEGEIIEMSPIRSRHASCVDRLNELLVRTFGKKAIVRVQNPVVLSRHSEPQPDLALVRPRKDGYAEKHPEPVDVFAIIEVMDSSRHYDRGPKLRAYSKAQIPEVWLVDLTTDAIEVYREPILGGYRHISQFQRGQRLSLAAFPAKALRATSILG